jgi:predicted MFS family arabinose efflux permease
VISQAVVAVISPRVGDLSQSRGRKVILLAGFAALALRCLVLTLHSGPYVLLATQLLDGISAASIGVMVPLIAADITHRGGRYNLAMGLVGVAMSIGATLSTSIAGWVTQYFGTQVAFGCLAVAAAVGCALVVLTLPETGPVEKGGPAPAKVAVRS